MKQAFTIGNYSLKKQIGYGHKPFLIAEMSGNHNQSLDRALQIVDAAAAAGADALKIQTYTADTMTLNIKDGEFLIKDEKNLWNGKNLYKLYEEAHTPWDWHKAIFERCTQHGMIGFSTPFDESAVDFLEKLQTPLYKIASFENTCIPLLKRIAKTKKPVIMSTGMASVGELEESVQVLKTNGCENLVLLKCTSTYPALPENSNILTIPHMRELFSTQIGLSDHTMGIGVAVASVALGATVIEKHFTLQRADGGVDSAFSLEPAEFKLLSTETLRAWQGLGSIHYGSASTQEEKSKSFRRSIYVAQDISRGQIFTSENIRCIRPGYGLETKYYELALGKPSTQDLKKGMPMKRHYISE